LGFARWVLQGACRLEGLFAAVGGECESWCFLRGYSVLPSALDKPSGLEPNSSYMQKPIWGRSLLAQKTTKTMRKLAASNRGRGDTPRPDRFRTQ
jgi:hypothetical protein